MTILHTERALRRAAAGALSLALVLGSAAAWAQSGDGDGPGDIAGDGADDTAGEAPGGTAGGSGAPATVGDLVDGIVAVVGAEPVTRFELDRAVLPFLAQAAQRGSVDADVVADLRREALQALVNDLLVLAEARKLDLTVSPEQVEGQISRIKDANGWDDDVMEEAVKQGGFTSLAAYRAHVERELLKSQVVSIRVGARIQIDPSEVEQVYRDEFGGGTDIEERQAAHILLRVPELATEMDAEAAKAKLNDVRAAIVSGELSFEDAARAHSEDRNAASGGNLGWFSKGDLVPEFEAAAYALDIGAVSEPVRTMYGFHLVKVIDTRTKSSVSAEDKEKILRQIQFRLREKELERVYTQWVRGLRAQAFVEVLDRGLAAGG